MNLVVTTAARVRPREVERARRVAQRCGAELVDRRRGPLETWLGTGSLAYVAGRTRDQIRSATAVLWVHEGMLRSRLHTGTQHPLIRALAPTGQADRIVDGTLGLAGDALHIASALTCEVLGYEASAPLYCLLEEGLTRLASGREPAASAAARVHPTWGDCEPGLRALDPDSADAVLLAPMYERPDKAMPGFELLRAVALHAPLSTAQIEAALRVAPRVVVKWPRGKPKPPPLDHCGRVEQIAGHRVDYWIGTR